MTDKVCIVVGGGKGMGAAIAREMKKKNYTLSLMSPSENCEILANDNFKSWSSRFVQSYEEFLQCLFATALMCLKECYEAKKWNKCIGCV